MVKTALGVQTCGPIIPILKEKVDANSVTQVIVLKEAWPTSTSSNCLRKGFAQARANKVNMIAFIYYLFETAIIVIENKKSK